MNILLVFLLHPLLEASQVTKPAIKQALDLMLFNETHSPLYCWFDCHNRQTCGSSRPDTSKKATEHLPTINYRITKSKFINKNQTRVHFFIPHINTYFSAIKIGKVFLINSERYICSAKEFSQLYHTHLSEFARELWNPYEIVPTMVPYSKKWDRSFLRNPMIYQECGQPERQIFRDTCSEDEANLMKRTKNDEILEANYVEGSNYLQIRYTSITWDDDMKKYGVKTEFIIEVTGSHFEYIHMKDICE